MPALFQSSMMSWSKKLVLGAAFATAMAQTALALEGDALSQSCDIRAALAERQNGNPIDTIIKYFSWNNTLAESRIRGGLVALQDLKFTRAQVFEGISAAPYYQTAIVAAGLEQNSPIFMELRFELVGETVRMTNVNFKDDLKKLYPNVTPNLKLTAIEC